MKRLIVFFMVGMFLLAGCAAAPLKYEPRPFTPPPKMDAYKLPPDPTATLSPPVALYLKKSTDGKSYIICSQADAEISAYTRKELDKIDIRLTYYKNLAPQLENLINIGIIRENMLIDLQVDQNLSKELFREMYVEMYNKNASDKNMFNIEQGGYLAAIIALIIEMGIIVAK